MARCRRRGPYLISVAALAFRQPSYWPRLPCGRRRHLGSTDRARARKRARSRVYANRHPRPRRTAPRARRGVAERAVPRIIGGWGSCGRGVPAGFTSMATVGFCAATSGMELPSSRPSSCASRAAAASFARRCSRYYLTGWCSNGPGRLVKRDMGRRRPRHRPHLGNPRDEQRRDRVAPGRAVRPPRRHQDRPTRRGQPSPQRRQPDRPRTASRPRHPHLSSRPAARAHGSHRSPGPLAQSSATAGA